MVIMSLAGSLGHDMTIQPEERNTATHSLHILWDAEAVTIVPEKGRE